MTDNNEYLKFNNLFARLSSGDESAFDDIYDNTIGTVTIVINNFIEAQGLEARGFAFCEDFKDDVTADTYSRFIKSYRSILNPVTTVKWFQSTAHNCCVNVIKSSYYKQTLDCTDIEALSDVASPAGEDAETLFRELAGRVLTPSQYHLMKLYAIDGLDYKELATVLHCQVGTIKSRIHTCRKILKAAIGNDGPDLAA